MAHKGGLEALNKSLKEVRRSDKPFGGVSMLLSGDMRQILPVVPRGTPADELDACIKSSYLWGNIKVLRLKTNMRVRLSGNNEARKFAANLLRVGNGTVPADEEGRIELSFLGTNIVHTQEELITAIYPNLESRGKSFYNQIHHFFTSALFRGLAYRASNLNVVSISSSRSEVVGRKSDHGTQK